MPYDPSTDAGKVRLLIADPGAAVFTDDEITAFLSLSGDSVLGAAAFACISLASLYAANSDKLTVLDIQVDFTQRSKAMQAQAKLLTEQDQLGGGFAVAAMVDSPFALEERRRKERQLHCQ